MEGKGRRKKGENESASKTRRGAQSERGRERVRTSEHREAEANHHVDGLSSLSSEVLGEKRRKGEKRPDRRRVKQERSLTTRKGTHSRSQASEKSDGALSDGKKLSLKRGEPERDDNC